MALATIRKGFVIQKFIRNGQRENRRYVAFGMSNATVNHIDKAWVHESYNSALEYIFNSLSDGYYDIVCVVCRKEFDDEMRVDTDVYPE
jgi:hypothetical protein